MWNPARIPSRVTLVAFVATLWLVADRFPDAPESSAPSIEPVNPIVGDASFVDAFGRAPTGDDNEDLRVRTHLAFVEGALRSADVLFWPAHLQVARQRNLDLLRRYWQAGVFPQGEDPAHRRPTFIDDTGRRCAVAFLVEAASGTEVISRINRRFRNEPISAMDDAGLAAWLKSSGLTPLEVATIQPNYRGSREWERTFWRSRRMLEPFISTVSAVGTSMFRVSPEPKSCSRPSTSSTGCLPAERPSLAPTCRGGHFIAPACAGAA